MKSGGKVQGSTGEVRGKYGGSTGEVRGKYGGSTGEVWGKAGEGASSMGSHVFARVCETNKTYSKSI